MIPPASTGATISPDGKEIWIGGHGDGNQVNESVSVFFTGEKWCALYTLHLCL